MHDVTKLTAFCTVLFNGRATTRKRKSLDLFVNFLGRVRDHNAAVAVTGRHLAGMALKRGKEF